MGWRQMRSAGPGKRGLDTTDAEWVGTADGWQWWWSVWWSSERWAVDTQNKYSVMHSGSGRQALVGGPSPDVGPAVV